MDIRKRKRLEAAGWRVGGTREFLGLSEDEAVLVDTRIALTELVRDLRKRTGLTQTALAQRLRSSQSRVAKIEAGDASVSLDLIVRAAVAAGAKRSDLARVIARPSSNSSRR